MRARATKPKLAFLLETLTPYRLPVWRALARRFD